MLCGAWNVVLSKVLASAPLLFFKGTLLSREVSRTGLDLRHDWKTSFQYSNPSVNKIKTNTKNPWSELKTVKRIWKVSLSPETEMVRTKKIQVRPKRSSTPLMLIVMRKICLLLMVVFVRAAFFLACRITTLTTQKKMTVLTIIITKIGARNAPISAPTCDRKQLQKI